MGKLGSLYVKEQFPLQGKASVHISESVIITQRPQQQQLSEKSSL